MKRRVLPGVALALLIALPGAAMGQIYRTTDAQGNVVFTDTPPPGGGAEQVQLQRTNTAEPTPPAEPPTATEPEQPVEEAPPERVVRIVSPANEETIPMGGGNFSVTARVEPALAKGQAMRLLLDGEPTGKLQPSGFWDLESVVRGAHDLTVEVIEADGTVVSRSGPVRVYVMRPAIGD